MVLCLYARIRVQTRVRAKRVGALFLVCRRAVSADAFGVMGYALELCEGTDENHYQEFICVICTQLVESPVLAECSHVFCSGCVEQWIGAHSLEQEQNHKCPTCSARLHTSPQPLAKASPLAWRVLGRVRVRCPLPMCSWRGEYSEVSSHLLNSESHVGKDRVGSVGSIAAGLREQADHKFDSKLYKEAITLYSKALAAQSDASTLAARGRAWAACHEHAQALGDARQALKLDASLPPANALFVHACVSLGRFEDAARHLESVVLKDEELGALERTVEALVEAERAGRDAFNAGEYKRAKDIFASMMGRTAAPSVQLWLARAELGLGLCDQAIRRTRPIIKEQPTHAGALTVRGQAFYLNCDFEQAWKHLSEALRLDPDDSMTQGAAKKARKVQRASEGAKSAAFNRNFTQAVQLTSEAISVADPPMRAPLHAMLFAERAAAYLRLKEFDKCLADCAKALYGSENECKPAALTRASALHALGRHEEALDGLRELQKLYGHDAQISHAFQRANFEVRKMRRPDLYALLRVPTVASTPEIKQAYKLRALELHPDKAPAGDEEAKRVAEEQFKQLGEALEILTDDFKRKLWDEGYDREAIQERVQAADRAARHHTDDQCCRGQGGCHG